MSARRLAHLMGASILVVVVAACSSSGSGGADDRGGAPGSPRASAGCRDRVAAGVAPGRDVTVTVAGGRWYLRHVPRSHDGRRPRPVVVDLHGYGVGAEKQAEISGFGRYGDRRGFVTITPQGSGPVAMWDATPGSVDERFIGTVLDDVAADLCVDLDRVYLVGMSNGAGMASVLGCRFADRVAAVAAVAGVRRPLGCRPSRPVPIVAFHGTDDRFAPWTGGIGENVKLLPAPDGRGTIGSLDAVPEVLDPGGPPVPDVIADWAALDGCGRRAEQRRVAPDVTMTRYPCPTGVGVELYRVDGGGHTWPGSTGPQGPETLVGATTTNISATRRAWSFMAAHPLVERDR